MYNKGRRRSGVAMSAAFRAVRVASGKSHTHLSHEVATAAGNLSSSVDQFCEAISLLCGPWLWEGMPVVPLRQAAEIDARVWP